MLIIFIIYSKAVISEFQLTYTYQSLLSRYLWITNIKNDFVIYIVDTYRKNLQCHSLIGHILIRKIEYEFNYIASNNRTF